MADKGKLPAFHILYVVSFIEGGALMAVELLSSKIIAPFYGASLYVWTAVLGMTLGGLAIGYYLGGMLTSKKKDQVGKLLWYVLGISAILCLTMPFYGKMLLEGTISMSLKSGITFASLVLLVPVLCCFGMVSPFIIHLLSEKYEVAGPAAGTIYGVSTFGGVIFSLVFGLYFIPFIGIQTGFLTVGGLLLLTALVWMLGSKKEDASQVTEGVSD